MGSVVSLAAVRKVPATPAFCGRSSFSGDSRDEPAIREKALQRDPEPGSSLRHVDAELLENALDRAWRVMEVTPLDRWPHEPTPEFRRAAVDVVREIARIRFAADGGDPEELDALAVEDTSLVVDPDDVWSFVEGFHDDGDQRREAACWAVHDWLATAQRAAS